MTVQAAIDALGHDAGMRDQVAQVTRLAGQHAGELTLNDTQLSWAAVPTGLADTYAEVQEKVAALLGEANGVYGGLGRTLDQVAAAYELSDQDAAARLAGVWNVRD